MLRLIYESEVHIAMKVSVVTVCFNSASTIEATLQSVKEQTWDNIEHIIIDGASLDGTVDIVNAHRDRISCLVSEPDGGIYDAMNKGVDLASGEIVYFLNSDDRLSDPSVAAADAVILPYLEVWKRDLSWPVIADKTCTFYKARMSAMGRQYE